MAGRTFDVVVGNPPYLSQLAAATTRGGASRHGGGPYADAAVEFLALAVRMARSGGGRVGLVLPQSILASRDAGARARRRRPAGRRSLVVVVARARSSTPQVLVCAVVAEVGAVRRRRAWTDVVDRARSACRALPAAGARPARSATGLG